VYIDSNPPLRDIVEVAEELGLELEPQTGGELAACCPIHGDTNPSLFVNETKQVWFCHGCNRGGNAVTLARFLNADVSIAYDNTVRDGHFPIHRLKKLTVDGHHLGVRFLGVSLLARMGIIDPALLRDIDIAAVMKDDLRLESLLDVATLQSWRRVIE